MTKCFRENLVRAPAFSRRFLTTYVPLRPEHERERVFEEMALFMNRKKSHNHLHFTEEKLYGSVCEHDGNDGDRLVL